MSDRTFLFTSESVTEGHPDKLCDQISDAILDACLTQDPKAKVACETCAATNFIMVFGEITTTAIVDYESVVRQTVQRIGYDDEAKGLDYKTMEVKVSVCNQSPEIAAGVHVGRSEEDVGAGDQGHVFGYACNETPELMPLTHSLASRLAERLSFVRKSHECPWMRPDGKTQVTVEYAVDGYGGLVPQRVHTILVSTQHDPHISHDQIVSEIKSKVIGPTVPSNLLDEHTLFIINPSGSFVVGGPHGDAGLTGRKIIVDTYGGWGSHGGGCFSGKDATKVDRSAAYMARHVAKSLVANGFASRVSVQISYAIGIANPISLYVDTFGTCVSHKCLNEKALEELVEKSFDFRPGKIVSYLQLHRPVFSQTAVYGHFGRPNFEWEKTKALPNHPNVLPPSVCSTAPTS